MRSKPRRVNGIQGAVETAWLRLNQAREQFRLFDSAVELARENLRLRERAFEEGQSVTIDVNEARNSLIRAETGRAQVAYEFVVVARCAARSLGPDRRAFPNS